MASVIANTKIQEIRTWLGSGSINIFGLPFSGKDTHAKIMADDLGGEIIGGGDIIRNTPEHADINKIISTGSLAPTEEYVKIVTPYFSQDRFAGKPLILSSVGRWHGEHESIIEAAEESGHPIKVVIYLIAPIDEINKRWSLAERQRHDDRALHILEKRFSEFNEKTLPVIQAYRDLGLLIEVQSTPGIDEVTQEIYDKLYLYSKNC